MLMNATRGGVRQERALASRRKILVAAVEQFAARPYNEVSALDITKQAGVAEGLLFHHFGSKRGVYLEAVRQVSRELFELDVVDPTAPPSVQIREMLRQHFSRLAEHADLLIGYVRGSMAMATDPEAWDVFEGIRMEMVKRTCDLAQLDLSSSPALRLVMRTAGDVLDRISVRWLESGQPFEADAMVDIMVQVIVDFFALAERLDGALHTAHVAELFDPGGRG